MRELIALLNTVNRVRGASNKLTPDVAAAYRPKLAYIANAYRVATTAVVERVEHWRKHDATQQPQLTNVSPHVETELAQPSASWLSGGLFQRQIVPRAAPGFGQPGQSSKEARRMI